MNYSTKLIYESPDGKTKIDVQLEDETVWLVQNQMATLFGHSKKTISEHIRNIFDEGERDKQVVVRKFQTTAQHGALAAWPQSDFADDRDGCLFTATVHRKPVVDLQLVNITPKSSPKSSPKTEEQILALIKDNAAITTEQLAQ